MREAVWRFLAGWLMTITVLCTRGASQDHASWADKADADYRNAPPEAVEAWKDLKYGMRILWGVYSVLGCEATWPTLNASPEFKSIYNTLYQVFNPSDFQAEEWVRLMERGGMKYFVFTAKHHDGFCMFHTESKVEGFRRIGLTYNDNRGIGKIEKVVMHYDIGDTLFRRDVVRELADAARKRGIGVGLYYSNHDWFDDVRFTRSKDRKYVYAISLRWPGRELRLRSVRAAEGATIRMLGREKPLAWRQDAEGLIIDVPEELQIEANRRCKQAYAFKIPVP